jgi:hypothetical protein
VSTLEGVSAGESGIEEAYGAEPGGQLHGCPTCNVTWFGPDAACWVCGATADGPAAAVPPNGSQTWSASRCVETDDDAETAAFVRRMAAASAGSPEGGSAPGVVVFPVLGS